MRKFISLLIFFIVVFNIVGTSFAVSVKDKDKYKDKIFLPYHVGYTLLKSGRLKSFSDNKRIISEKIYIDNNVVYHFKNLSAKYGNCLYVVYDSENRVISYLKTDESSEGEIIDDIEVIMPKNASYFRVACDLKVNNKMFEATKSDIKLNEKKHEPAVISFIDDDCRSQVYTELYPLIKKLDLPYTLACPPNSLNDEAGRYMTTEQVKEVYSNGVNIVSHHLKEYAMTEFDFIEDYEKDTEICLQKFKEMGIEVNGVAYPNGLIKDEYMNVVKDHFKLGFTTDRGINTLPYESCYIHRCEVFPKSGIYNIDDAKALVDSVSENGGWLVFMTHCWFDTFSAEDLEELVNYIRRKNIEIANVSDIIENYSNQIDIGIVKKPFSDMADDFFVMDCNGRAYTNKIGIDYNCIKGVALNRITILDKSSIKWRELSVDYNYGTTLLPSGKEKNHLSDISDISKINILSQKKRNVSRKIYVEPGRKYKLTNLSARYGNCLYVIYNSDNKVIQYYESPNSDQGRIIDELILTMPADASYFKVACDLNICNKIFKVYSEV